MTKLIHIMIDLETWSLRPNADIRSIGAVVFDPTYGYTAIPCGDENNDFKSFYIACDNPIIHVTHGEGGNIQVQKHHLVRDQSTIDWWATQSAEAQKAFDNPVDLKIALERFIGWFNSVTEGFEPSNVRIWANDPQNDVIWLQEAFRACKLETPWHYRSPRSVRTVVEDAGLEREDLCNFGDAHNALHDAIAQAMTVCKCYRVLGKAEYRHAHYGLLLDEVRLMRETTTDYYHCIPGLRREYLNKGGTFPVTREKIERIKANDASTEDSKTD